MEASSSPPQNSPSQDSPAKAKPSSGAPKKELAPARQRGRTEIDDEVVSVIARIAAEQVQGIYKIGDSALRGLFSRMGRRHGVESEVGLKEAAIDIEITVEFGFGIREIAEELRERVIESVETMAGQRVLEVNVFVIDVHVPKTEHRHRRQLE